jgi:hypothetical protein
MPADEANENRPASIVDLNDQPILVAGDLETNPFSWRMLALR